MPKHHPLRPIRLLVDEVLIELSPVFQRIYARTGRPSIPSERIIRALVLMMLYSIRSERQLMERINFNILFRWFVGLGLDDRVWDVTVFSKNRQRLLAGEIDVNRPGRTTPSTTCGRRPLRAVAVSTSLLPAASLGATNPRSDPQGFSDAA